jgi:hypothetical protein
MANDQSQLMSKAHQNAVGGAWIMRAEYVE